MIKALTDFTGILIGFFVAQWLLFALIKLVGAIALLALISAFLH